MGDLTKNISRSEVLCKCGMCDFAIERDSEVLFVVQEICNHFDSGVVIHSGARCTEYNRSASVGSNDKSQHPRCTAIDFHIKDAPLEKVYMYLMTRYPDKYGMGIYDTFIHLDVRPVAGRWDKRS